MGGSTSGDQGKKLRIEVCHGRQCGRSCKYLMERLAQVQQKGYDVQVDVATCFSRCEEGPNAAIDGVIYTGLNPIKIADLVKKRAPRRQGS